MCYEFKTPLLPGLFKQPKQSDLSVTSTLQSVNRWRHNEYSCCPHPLPFVQLWGAPVVKVRLVVWRSDLIGEGATFQTLSVSEKKCETAAMILVSISCDKNQIQLCPMPPRAPCDWSVASKIICNCNASVLRWTPTSLTQHFLPESAICGSSGQEIRTCRLSSRCSTLRKYSRIITYPCRMGQTIQIWRTFTMFTYQPYTVARMNYAIFMAIHTLRSK